MYCRMLDAMLSKGQEDENGILFVCFPVTAIATVLSRSPMTVSYTHLYVGGGYLIVKVRGKLTRCEADKLELILRIFYDTLDIL